MRNAGSLTVVSRKWNSPHRDACRPRGEEVHVEERNLSGQLVTKYGYVQKSGLSPVGQWSSGALTDPR